LHPPDDCRLNSHLLTTTNGLFPPPTYITKNRLSHVKLREWRQFKDVSRSHWYYGAVGSAKKHGIINGYDDGTFRGTVNIPKVQIVAIAARTLVTEMKYKKPVNTESLLNTYTDTSAIANWAAEDVALATRENLVLKRTDGKFLSDDRMTRGDAAIILKRMFDRIW
jgi:hypothetical protein